MLCDFKEIKSEETEHDETGESWVLLFIQKLWMITTTVMQLTKRDKNKSRREVQENIASIEWNEDNYSTNVAKG